MVIQFPTMAIRPNVLKKGEKLIGHTHEFDHLTAAIRGAFQIDVTRPDGQHGRRIVRAGPDMDLYHSVESACFHVPRGWYHTITGLAEINEFWCLYLPRDEEGKAIEYHPAEVDQNYYTWISG